MLGALVQQSQSNIAITVSSFGHSYIPNIIIRPHKCEIAGSVLSKQTRSSQRAVSRGRIAYS